MLHKSFKPAKCKTALKLATSRTKLMKNKKGVQINQIKRDLAQLLESGQDRTARIRVEHLIREEKMVAAYDLIEIYCELIVARLPIIESQKTCPIDLKEAVTSVIFAAPRCSDITELLDIRKHFAAKYGKEFVSAAIELRPECGVSRMLVEKLSAVAPDVQTKIKVLSAVAKEHDIKWDPTSFEEEKESEPPNDLLNGPANFEKASMTNADPPKIHASNIHAVHGHEEKQDASFDFSQQNRKYILDTRKITSIDSGGVETSSAAAHADMRSSGTTSERMEMRQPFPRGNNDISSDRQNWNMEFKDATTAAQAAAESAERASMAARAAAQLSSHGKITRQYSTESHESNIREEIPQVSAPSEFPGHGHFRDSYKSSFDDSKPNILNQQMYQSEHDTSPKATERFYGASHGGAIRSSIPAPFQSNNDSLEDEKLVNNFHMTDGYFQESLHEDQEGPSSPEMSTPKGYKESKAELGSGQKEGFESDDFNCFAKEVTKKQPSSSSSHSHSSTTSDELDVPGHQKFGKRTVVGNPFAVVDHGNLFRETTNMSSNVDAPRDDEAISDDDDSPRFDTGFEYDEVEGKSYFPSPGRQSPIRSLENAHIWSPRRYKSDTVDQVNSQSHLFSESRSFNEHSVKSVEPSETDNHIPVSFDHSDGPDSKSESELGKSSFSGIKEFTSPHECDPFSTNPEPLPVESSQNFRSRKSRIELNDLVEKESTFYNAEDQERRSQSQQSSILLHESKNNTGDPRSYDTLEGNNDSLNQSNDLDAVKELNFGTLTGGLRNKGGLTYPPYAKSAGTDASSLSKKSGEESSVTGDQTSPQSSFISRVSRLEDKQPSVCMSSSDSDSDNYGDKFPVESSQKASSFISRVSRMEDKQPTVSVSSSDSDSDNYGEKFPVQSSQKASKRANTRSRFSPSVAFFNDDGTDSEEEIPKQVSSRVRLGSALSRRTKGSPSVPYSKSHVEPEAKTVISSSIEDRKPNRYAGRFKKEDAKQIPESQAVEQRASPSRKTSEIGSTEAQRKPSINETPSEPQVHPANFKQEAFKTMPEPTTPARKPVVQSPTPQRNTVESGKTETAKTPNLGSGTSLGENILKKPSHVQSKLPDYDSLAARIQSLRTDRQ